MTRYYNYYVIFEFQCSTRVATLGDAKLVCLSIFGGEVQVLNLFINGRWQSQFSSRGLARYRAAWYGGCVYCLWRASNKVHLSQFKSVLCVSSSSSTPIEGTTFIYIYLIDWLVD